MQSIKKRDENFHSRNEFVARVRVVEVFLVVLLS